MRLTLSALGPLFLLVFLACGSEASADVAPQPGVSATLPPVAEGAPAVPGSQPASAPTLVAPTPAVVVPGAATEPAREATPTVSQPPSTNANDSGDLPSGAAGRAEPTPTLAAAGETVAAALFSLPAARGGEVSLASYAGNKSVVLTFYRAFW